MRTSTPPVAPASIGPIAGSQRSLAPDLARGMLLLFIAVANVSGYLYGRELGLGFRPVNGTAADHVVDGFVAFFADDRSRPMFAILYGYGIATMAGRMAAKGLEPKPIRSVLRRRSLWLIVFGLLHAGLLFSGDILAPYGATGLIALALVHRRRGVLLWWCGVSLVTGLAGSVLLASPQAIAKASGQEPPESYLATMTDNLMVSVLVTVFATVSLFLLSQVVLGFFIARSGWLDHPDQHRGTLRRVLWWALAANLVGNLPHALAVAGAWRPAGGAAVVVELAHVASGLVMGLGYVCGFALIAAGGHRIATSRAVAAVSAVGQRSLTSYLLQSVMLAPLLSRWGLDLGRTLGTAAATALAVAVWLVTLAVAVRLDRAGRRGPFEVLLRRLTYARRQVVVTPVPAAHPV